MKIKHNNNLKFSERTVNNRYNKIFIKQIKLITYDNLDDFQHVSWLKTIDRMMDMVYENVEINYLDLMDVGAGAGI